MLGHKDHDLRIDEIRKDFGWAMGGGAALAIGSALLALRVGRDAWLLPLVAMPFAMLWVGMRQSLRFGAKLNELHDDVLQIEPYIALAGQMPTRAALPPMRVYAIAPDFALMLHSLVRERRPELVLETGSGVSTLVAAYALQSLGRGRVVALEHDAAHAERTRREIERHGLAQWARVVHAPLEDVVVDGEDHRWYAQRALDGIGPIDLVVDDGPPRHAGRWLRYASMHLLLDKMSADGLFVLDCIGREEGSIVDRWLKRFPQLSAEWIATKKGNVFFRMGAAGKVRPGGLEQKLGGTCDGSDIDA